MTIEHNIICNPRIIINPVIIFFISYILIYYEIIPIGIKLQCLKILYER
jgi:hypothetical protein